jgi:GTP-binding protein
MKFLDDVVLLVRSGAGGAGAMSFRREKFVEFGGPDGGNGGKGGCVWVEADQSLNTLVDYRFRPVFKAQTGGHGMGRNRTGAEGKDLTLKVPPGTEIINAETDEVLFDLTQVGERVRLLRGGRGGRGNASYKTSTNQAPRQFTPGGEAEEMRVRFRLKLLADVGLLGLPNAGKSSFVRAVSRAKPKVADYPFTTLHPALGLVRSGTKEMLLADLPGLIAGAAEGTGLGHKFLMHVSRCRAVLHLVDATQEAPEKAYKTIRAELKKYDKEYGTALSKLAEVVGLTKADLLSDADAEAIYKAFAKATKTKPVLVSSTAKTGLDDLTTPLMELVHGVNP